MKPEITAITVRELGYRDNSQQLFGRVILSKHPNGFRYQERFVGIQGILILGNLEPHYLLEHAREMGQLPSDFPANIPGIRGQLTAIGSFVTRKVSSWNNEGFSFTTPQENRRATSEILQLAALYRIKPELCVTE
ncbi:MAG: hypothetical protein WCJ29_06260 [bacterium]